MLSFRKLQDNCFEIVLDEDNIHISSPLLNEKEFLDILHRGFLGLDKRTLEKVKTSLETLINLN